MSGLRAAALLTYITCNDRISLDLPIISPISDPYRVIYASFRAQAPRSRPPWHWATRAQSDGRDAIDSWTRSLDHSAIKCYVWQLGDSTEGPAYSLSSAATRLSALLHCIGMVCGGFGRGEWSARCSIVDLHHLQ